MEVRKVSFPLILPLLVSPQPGERKRGWDAGAWVDERLCFGRANVLQRSKKKETKKQIGQIPITSGRKRDDLEAYSVEPNPTPIMTIMYRLSQVVCPLDPWI